MGEGLGLPLPSFVFPLNPIYFREVKVMKSQQHCCAQINLREAALGKKRVDVVSENIAEYIASLVLS